MRLPQLFRRERTYIERASAQDQVQKLLVESLRVLSDVCGRVANLIETQRLERAGYKEQGTALRRLDGPPEDKR